MFAILSATIRYNVVGSDRAIPVTTNANGSSGHDHLRAATGPERSLVR